tara:strand:- start:81 stop:1154 length:1074 start_codon:yes stop_codon:yes gene_type:complete
MEKIKSFYKNKKVLVTGATGFKGSWLCVWLLKLGAQVNGIGYNPNQNKTLFYKLKLNKKINLKILDIRDYKSLNNFINKTKPAIIFHMAAQPLIYESYVNPLSTFQINSFGTLNILEIVKNAKFVKSLVSITSDKCYENKGWTRGYKESDVLGGVDPYSASKASAELMIRAYKESFFGRKKKCGISSARAGNVIGGGDWSAKRLIPDCIRALMKNTPIFLRNPKFNRPWQHVLEPLKGYLILAKRQYEKPSKFSGAWNFGTQANSITDVKQIVKYMILFWGSGSLKKQKKIKFYEQHNLQLDITKAKKELNWKPTYNVKDSVKVTTKWYFRVMKGKENPIRVTNMQIDDYMYENNWS